MSTMAGQPLYEAAGFEVVSAASDASGGAPVPLFVMRKSIDVREAAGSS